jgi:hypothetical protein
MLIQIWKPKEAFSPNKILYSVVSNLKVSDESKKKWTEKSKKSSNYCMGVYKRFQPRFLEP